MKTYSLDGVVYPSVTEVLKLISTNDELMKWANAMGFKRKDIADIQKESTTRGTIVHSHLQAYVDNTFTDQLPPTSRHDQSLISKSIRRIDTFLEGTSWKTIFTEKSLVSSSLGYGGTADWYVDINGKKYIVDFKTSKRYSKTMALQLGAYANLFTSYGYDVDGAIIMITNDSAFLAIELSSELLLKYRNMFNVLTCFRSTYLNTSIGTPVSSARELCS